MYLRNPRGVPFFYKKKIYISYHIYLKIYIFNATIEVAKNYERWSTNLFNNPQQEEIELLSYDKASGYAMIHNLNRTYMPYAVVSCLDIRTGEWNAGHYFTNEKEAYDFHREQINAFDENRYRHAVEYLIREEFEAIEEYLSNEKISELFERVVMKSDEAKILNKYL